MRWIIAVLGLVLAGSVQAGFAPRYVTDLPCGSDTRPLEAYELELHSTKDFLAAYNKMPCSTNTMIEALYVYGGHEPPAISSMFDARINPPTSNLDGTQKEYYRNRKDIDRGISYSWDVLRAKKYDEAIAVLEDLYAIASSSSITPPFEQRKDFNQHILAKQLAYAYELNGNTQKALQWAQTRQSLSPTRMGWLHVAVLQNKLQHRNAQRALPSTLNLPFRNDGFFVPRIDLTVQGEPASLRQMIDTTAAFLYERTELYPDNDPITASLLFDLGYLVALTGAYEDAQYVFDLSHMYGDVDASSAKRSFEFREIGRHWVDWVLFAVCGFGLIVGAIGFAWVYRWCLRYRAKKTGTKSLVVTLLLGFGSGVGVFGLLIALVAWILSLTSTTGQAPSNWELLLFLTIVGLTLGGMVVGWMHILHQEIVAIGVKRYWINMALGGVWVLGWMTASLLSAISDNPQQLALNELLPIILMMPVVAGFVMWVKGLRAHALSQTQEVV